jgi:malate synthase A
MKEVTFIRPSLAQEFTKDILTSDTLSRFAELVRTKVADGRTLEEVRRDRVEARPAKQARLDAGEPLDFLPENEAFTFLDGTTMTVKEIREADWKVDGQPRQFDGRRVQLTGPCSEPAMAIGAMNTGQQWMADSEDAAAQSTDAPLRTQRSLKLLCTWTPEGRRALDGAGGKRLKPENEVAIMIYRPRGLHLDDRHLLVDGQAVSGGFVDAWLFLRHNAKALLDRGLPVAFYLPKLECVEDADLWHTFLYEAEKALDLPPGTVKVYVLVEIINATYQLEEMMYAFTRPIRDGRTGKAVPASRFIGPNVGRWDYMASMYRATRADLAGIPPDTNLVTMDGARFLAVYEQYVSDMARRRGAVPWGGMSANILLRATLRPGDFEKIAGKEGAPALLGALQAAGYVDPKGSVTGKFTPGTDTLPGLPAPYEPQRKQIIGILEAYVARAYNNKVALEKASDDKTRESGLRLAKDGGRRCYYGAWVATPDMVAVIQPVFEKAAREGLLAALDTAPTRTDWYSKELAAGLLAFPEGLVTEDGMREDITITLQYMASYLRGSAAAAVTSPQLKLQLMEDLATAEIRRAALWKRLHAGAVLQGEGPLAGKRLTEEVFLRLLDEETGKLKGKSVDTAQEILRWTTTAKKLIPWISDPLNVVLDEESPEVITAALKAYFDTFVTTGKRLTRVAGADIR